MAVANNQAMHDFTISFDWDDIGSVYVSNADTGGYEARLVLQGSTLSLFRILLRAISEQLDAKADALELMMERTEGSKE